MFGRHIRRLANIKPTLGQHHTPLYSVELPPVTFILACLATLQKRQESPLNTHFFNSRTVCLHLMIASGIVFLMLHFCSMSNRINRTIAYQDIKTGYCASIWKKLDVISSRSKTKINLIDLSKSHSQSATIRRLDEEYDDQRDLSSTPKTFF